MENNQEPPPPQEEDFSEASVPLLKEKKPRSAKQIEHFKNMKQKRTDNIENNKLNKKIESAKLLLEHDVSVPVKSKSKQKPPPVEVEEISSSEEEEEIIVKTKKSKKKETKPKKKSKKIVIIQESDSESEEEESEDDDEAPPAPKTHFKTQQNKKSIIKVHQSTHQHQLVQKPRQISFFCD